MQVDQLIQALIHRQGAAFGSAGVLVAALLLFSLVFLLPKSERRHIRTPLAFLVLHVLFIAIAAVSPDGTLIETAAELAAVFFLLVSIGRGAVLLFLHSILVRRLAMPVPKILRDLVQGVVYVFAIFVTLQFAGVEPGSLLTTSALLTAVIGLSLQDTLGNLFAGLAIQAQRPFQVGDWIQFDSSEAHIGCVVEINWRATTLRTIEEIEVTVPNGALAKAPIHNFSLGFDGVRRTVDVVAPYDVSPRTVHDALLRAVREVSGVLERPIPSVVTTGFGERGIQYRVRYFIRDFRDREFVASRVRTRIWYALQRAGVMIPAPQRSIRVQEASPESRQIEREDRIRAREAALSHVDFLQSLPVEARRRLAELSSTHLYAPGEYVVRQGEQGQEFFIVEWGEVSVTVQDPARPRRAPTEVARLGANKFFGEMSVMTGEKRAANVRAVRETEVLVVDKNALEEILRAVPGLAEQVSEILARRQEELQRSLEPPGSEQVSTSVPSSSLLLQRIKNFFSL